ncbi:hypothetical protein K439DRAFT_699498 [Ramaria rubella]|nr:hypothetical protein K439DRAFT_699498 [Ramaria rubella]
MCCQAYILLLMQVEIVVSPTASHRVMVATRTTLQDFINTYNRGLSSTFSHPTLLFIHHSQNWSVCSAAVTLPGKPNALSLFTDKSLLAVTAGGDVLIYITEGGLELIQTLKGHSTGYVSNVQ